MTPERMAELTAAVLANFARDLAAADDLQLEHLARRAEAMFATDLGRQERDLVNTERERRTAPGLQVTA